ncbi:hypothetical protein DWB85_14310 [Seongchinamella sediminis]|uniref:Uncharacterized protein n=1 Tax=Seongchinamella sediminis TaxID=2283635 RepID=A0A3L7DTZ9_9GAMM|nr:hypothetical protein [Seongchinamella sediminis]RLQ21067.1 hypothetical protein DWB85_14310 [Seongchinamella sediminis]
MTREAAAPYLAGFNPDYQGKRAECEGGAPIAETKYAGRQFFAGTLTGDYRDFDFGGYPWRWYLLADLTQKPEAYTKEAVWCEQESLILLDN